MLFKPDAILNILSNIYFITPLLSNSEHSFFSLSSTPKTKTKFKNDDLKASLIYIILISKENLNLLVKEGIIIIYYIEALHTKFKHYIKVRKRLEQSRASKH